jgi:hypothetical protein
VPLERILFLEKTEDGRAGTEIAELTMDDTLKRLLPSQTSIPNLNMLKRLRLNEVLARHVSAARLTYDTHCDLDRVAELLGSGA